MNLSSPVGQQQHLEQFRHLLFHLQMQCGSIHDIFRFFKDAESMEHIEALKDIDPGLMPQLLAREFVLEARKADTSEQARKNLETALQLDPNCAEALLEMAGLCDAAESSMMWYDKCMKSVADGLGEKRFQELIAEFKAHPWRQVELHCYLKAKSSLAEVLFRNGYYNVAILHLEQLLDWNPADEIGFRHFLMISYLCENNLAKATSLKYDFPDDSSAQWYYARAFLQFKLEGDTRRSQRLLQRAFRRNLWVPVYGLGLKKMPVAPTAVSNNPDSPHNPLTAFSPVTSPDQPFREGSQPEAVECVRCVAPAIYEDESLAKWVWEKLRMEN